MQLLLEDNVTTTIGGLDCSDSGLLDLSESECQNAYNQISGVTTKKISGLSMTNRPPACFYHSPSTYYWNRNANGDVSGCSSCYSVCKASKQNSAIFIHLKSL